MNNRAYVSGALMGSNDLLASRKLYDQFAIACKNANWEAYLPHKNTDPEDTADLSNVDVIQKDVLEICKSDAIVMYLGQPSLGVGAEIVIGLQCGIPIYAVFEDNRPISRFATGLLEIYPNGYLYAYSDVSDACDWITTMLKNSIAGTPRTSKNLPPKSMLESLFGQTITSTVERE